MAKENWKCNLLTLVQGAKARLKREEGGPSRVILSSKRKGDEKGEMR